MGTRSKDRIKAMIAKDISDIYKRCMEVKKSINDNLEETIDYLNALIAQIPESASGPLITKTPKVLRKKGAHRIETIPENEIIDITNVTTDSIAIPVENKALKTEPAKEIQTGRKKREASRKAADNIRKQQSLTLNTKLRRPSSFSEDNEVKNEKRESRNKRKTSARSSSDEESSKGNAKITKVEETIVIENVPENADSKVPNRAIKENTIVQQETIEASEKPSRTTRSNNRKRTFSQIQNISSKNSVIGDDTVIAPVLNDIEEPSMYEDAIGKPMPIMNSTMNFNSTYTMQKMINATVVLEPLSAIKLNETVTINKQMANSTEEKKAQSKTESKSTKLSSPKPLQDRMEQLKKAMTNKEFDELLTEDESSPEIKKPRPNIKTKEHTKRQKRVTRSSVISSEDEILNTPAKPTLKELNAITAFHETKNAYKPNALFSPYAKESVKKRVEAFEQVGMNSPKPTVDIDVPTRVTRTKTRAQAAAQAEIAENTKTSEKAITHKLARKSLAKAKKISLAKHVKDTDECKENKTQAKQKVLLEKVNQKSQKTTPLTKVRTQLPTSVSRIQQTPLSNQINTNHTKALSATRTNIITSMDSFLQPPKSVNKRNSIEKTEDKKRKLNDDDARKKREEALRLQTEEKKRKRQEKELKNKLAREAKEKQDMEKRQKAEREREEKARMAQQIMEKQREELEKKRMAQLQRAQEKEEKRKQEEQLRLQRLQEQEEAERALAEQRRREQEAEKRKEMETRAQQQTAAEAMKVKNQMIGSKYGHKHHGPTNYILDSEPDEDESDDESKPKHVIPYWAHPQVRKAQLAMQRYIPERAVFKFFGSRKCTPDLTELFQGIDKSRLKRTSSAIWRTPPRFSMMETERE